LNSTRLPNISLPRRGAAKEDAGMSSPKDRVTGAVERIRIWLTANAPELAASLRPGASPERIAAAEAELGFALPPGVRQLLATHDGNDDELGVLGHRYLFNLRLAVMEQDGVRMFVGFVRDNPGCWAEAGVTEAEVTSDRWVGVAGRDSDYLAVSIESGRVFDAWKDSPALELAAPSLEVYLEEFARSLELGRYEVDDAFGGSLLERRPEPHERLARSFVAGLVGAGAVALVEEPAAGLELSILVGDFCRRRVESGQPLTVTPDLPAELAAFLIEQAAVDDLFADDDQIRKLWIASLRSGALEAL
jgi:hypothetical protein